MQELLAFAIVLGAALYLARTFWASVKGSNCASGCNGCASRNASNKAAPQEPALIQITLTSRK